MAIDPLTAVILWFDGSNIVAADYLLLEECRLDCTVATLEASGVSTSTADLAFNAINASFLTDKVLCETNESASVCLQNSHDHTGFLVEITEQ